MTAGPFDRAALRAYIAEHHLTHRAMAQHIGMPYGTLRHVLGNEAPGPMLRARIEAALLRAPPPSAAVIGKYDEIVRELWGRVPLAEIARRSGTKSRQDIQQVARRLGLPKLRRGRRAPAAAE